MTKRNAIIHAVSGLALILPAAASAQAVEDADIVPLSEWSAERGHEGGQSVQALIDDVEVHDSSGEEIGDVENVLFDKDGQALSIIAEVGGFWDIGDTHVNVPWADVQMHPDGEALTVPVTEETIEDYSMFPDELVTRDEAEAAIEPFDDDPATTPRVWRATELIGDYSRLREGEGYMNYGYVDDIVLRDGEIAAVLVRPSAGFGTPGVYGYPYYGYAHGWGPGLPSYDLPYARGDVETLRPVDETETD